MKSSGTDVNTKINMQVSRLRMAIEAVIAKKDASSQIREHEQGQCAGLSDLVEAEYTRYDAEYINRYQSIYHKIAQSFTENNSQCSAIVGG